MTVWSNANKNGQEASTVTESDYLKASGLLGAVHTRPSSINLMLKVYLLVACVCVLAAATVYTFYLNRLIAAVIGLLLRIKYWNQNESSIWIKIGSIHFAILAGRILVNDFAYHSSNQTVKIVKIQVAWRYWLRVPATEDDLNNAHVGAEDFNRTDAFPPCRIKVSLQGFQWYLYNKTAAYEHIISQMQAKAPPCSEVSEPRRFVSRTSALEGFYPPSVLAKVKAPPIIHAALNWIKHQMPYLDPKDLLPISIEVSKLAIVCGNSSTPSLLVAECHEAEGTFGIVRARSKCDFYKQLLNFKFQNAEVQLVENEGYRGTMSNIGRSIQTQAESSVYADRIPLLYLSFRAFAQFWRGLRLYSSLFNPRRASISGQKKGTLTSGKLSRKSLDEDTFVGADFSKLEYAIERRILEAPILEFSYYADVVGEVPSEGNGPKGMGLESYDIGNGDLPPEWGIDLVIRRGVIRYGPWADRQRLHLQRTFFPPTYRDSQVSQRLEPGDRRIWTAMKVFIELREETSLNLPFREASKNWQWDGRSDFPRPKIREHASLYVTAGDSSSISYLIPMIIGPDGYESRLEVHLDTVQVTSSLNDIKLVNAESCRVHAALPSPLKWNAKRQWSFAVSLRQPIIFLLRDHINMFSDLSRDWTTGPLTEWHHFVPTVYSFELALHHFDLDLYANDQNIIDKPLIKDENSMVNLRAPRLCISVSIPANIFRPEATTITFMVDVPDIMVSMALPRWNTQSLYNQGKEYRVLHAGTFRLDASYHYWAEVRPENIEQLKLGILVRDVSFKTLGWVIRYFMVLRDNYLGSFTQFSTLTEYLDKRRRDEVGDPVEKKYRPDKSNILQVEMLIEVENGSLLLPAGLPGCEKHSSNTTAANDVGTSVLLTFPELHVDFRLHEYFMDMSLNVGLIKGCILDICSEDVFFNGGYKSFKETLYIDGVDITANRLFGPPPRTRTYVCVWEIALGHVKTVLSILDVRIVLAALEVFRINYADPANAPASEFSMPLDADLTFVKLSLKALNATCLAGTVALDVSLPRGLTVHTNDLQGQLCGKILSLRVPVASLKSLVTSGSSRKVWSEAAAADFDVNVESYASSQLMGNPQKKFLHVQDALTQRAQYLLSQIQKAREIFRGRPCTSALRRDPRPSHQIHRNKLYLPSLTLPHFHLVPHPSVPQQQRQLTSSRHWSQLSHMSESDTENISEADRDARLARSRILPIVDHQVDDNEQSVTDDESDNEDLADTGSSESDWSSSTAEHPQEALLCRYQRIAKQYKERFLGKVSSRDGSPFTLSKVPLSTFPKPRNCPKMSPSRSFRTPCVADPPISRTFIRVESVHKIEILVTPLVILVASRLKDEIELRDLSAELTLDNIVVRYMTNLVPLEKESPFPDIDLRMHSIHLRMVEQIHLRGNVGQVPSNEATAANRNVDLILHCSLAELCLTGTGGVGRRSSSSTRVTLHEMMLGLDSLPGALSGSDCNSACPELCLSLGDLQTNLKQENLDAHISVLNVQIGPSDLEYVGALLFTVKSDMEELSNLHRDWRIRSSRSFPALVRRILWHTKDHPTVDPMSIIQPSFLVQRGLPHSVRTNGTLKFLFHLRLSLRHCASALHVDAYDCPQQDFQGVLETCLANLMVDSDRSHAADPREMLYPSEKPGAAVSSLPITSVSATVGSLQLTALSVSAKSHSFITCTMLHLQYQSRALAQATNFTSQDSLAAAPLQQKVIDVSIDDVALTASPRLVDFTPGIIRFRRYVPSSGAVEPHPSQIRSASSQITILARIGDLNVRAGADNLTFEFGGSSLDFCSNTLSQPDAGTKSRASGFTFSNIWIRTRSKNADGDVPASGQDILASLTFTNGKINIVYRQDLTSSAICLVFVLEEILLSVPRSALRLYRFMQEWEADFLPAVDAAAETFMSELKGSENALTGGKPSSWEPMPGPVSLQVNGHVSMLGVTLQVMRGTWLSWNIQETTGFTSSTSASLSKRTNDFGLQFGSQAIAVTSKSRSTDSSTISSKSYPRVKLTLPMLTLTGQQGGLHIELLGALDFVDIMVKPSHWDTLLVVQQKFGQDFTDLMDLIQETRRKPSSLPSSSTPKAVIPSKYVGHVNVKGFRIGLEGPSSTFYLECKDVGGDIVKQDDVLQWRVQLRDLALSLAPSTGATTLDHGFNRNQKSAFVILDITLNASGKSMQTSIPKIQAVMQPSSIGELGDFIDYQQAELLTRRSQRAAELEAFKEKTRSILKTFGVRRRSSDLEKRGSWFREHSVLVEIERIGVAFPLTFGQNLELPQLSGRNLASIRAFLFSVRRIKFSTQRGENGQMTTKELSFSFVNRFRQSVSSDFFADAHKAQNQLVYPQMKVHLRSDTSLSKRHVWVTGSVSGFVLDLDSSISDCIFSLIDVYRQGRERMTRLASNIPLVASQSPELSIASPGVDYHTSSGAGLNIVGALVFESGVVRLHGSAHLPRPLSSTFSEEEDEYLRTTEMEIIKLPIVSAWIEYRTSAFTTHPGETRSMLAPALLFKSKIHSSQNTLKPMLLPFLTEVIDSVQTRLRKTSPTCSPPVSTRIGNGSIPPISPSGIDHVSEISSSLQINFSLRIDQSALQITCQPDVNVLAALRWESGGFAMSISPGAHRVTFTGSVDGLTVGLKHGFLSEDCVNLAARNLAFSLAIAKTEDDDTNADSSISLVVSTDISGGIRFSRLQDMLCFKAVWLDRIPLISAHHSQHDESNVDVPSSMPTSPTTRQEVTTAVVIQIRRIEVNVDLGQSISNISLSLADALVRSRLWGRSSEVSLSVADVAILAKGNISGHVIVSECIFQTTRRHEEVHLHNHSAARLLELTMTSGPLSAELESEHQRLLIYRADPIQVDIHDDWSLISSTVGIKDRPLLLAFTVRGKEVTALATIATVPKLMLYVNRFKANIAAQRIGASRESKAFRATQTIKPDNPLTEVASAFFHSARHRFKELEMDISYVVRQQMSFRLEMLRLIIFPRTMADAELAQFIGHDVHASLNRTVEDGLPSRRELHLSFATMNVSKISQLLPILPSTAVISNERTWINSLFKNPTEANIVGLPSMKMLMITEESVENLTTCLVYDFYSTFQGRGDKSLDDIYITLNVSLYSWLTGLRKNLSRELEQMQATLNAPLNSAQTLSSRKKANIVSPDMASTAEAPQTEREPSQTVSPVVSRAQTNAASNPPYGADSDGSASLETSHSQKRNTQPQESGVNMPRSASGKTALVYSPRERKIQRLTMRQLGEATPDVMHPFFMKKAGFNLEDSLPQYVHEYATIPLEEIMESLLRLYSKQLRTAQTPEDRGTS
ncbi:hypothetical protein F5I97DRAFT_2055646 [Phlebopus sp. FC_14]|nr:hypothetical protein F5I97DRAFT_2055646 [Phlebopus sp. FC_14]